MVEVPFLSWKKVPSLSHSLFYYVYTRTALRSLLKWYMSQAFEGRSVYVHKEWEKEREMERWRGPEARARPPSYSVQHLSEGYLSTTTIGTQPTCETATYVCTLYLVVPTQSSRQPAGQCQASHTHTHTSTPESPPPTRSIMACAGCWYTDAVLHSKHLWKFFFSLSGIFLLGKM